jgi:hypothetical protein
LVQTPALHTYGATQSVSPAQVVLQTLLVVSQTNEPGQTVIVAAWHDPAPSQVFDA